MWPSGFRSLVLGERWYQQLREGHCWRGRLTGQRLVHSQHELVGVGGARTSTWHCVGRQISAERSWLYLFPLYIKLSYIKILEVE